MMKKRIQKISFSFLTIAGLFINSAFGYDTKFVRHAERSYANSLGIAKESDQTDDGLFTDWNNFLEILKKPFKSEPFKLKSFTNREAYETLLNATPTNILSDENVIDKTFVNKTELADGSGKERRKNIFTALTTVKDEEGNTVDLLNTQAGKKFFLDILSQPITDVKELNKRQTIISTLVNNPAYLEQLDKMLQAITAYEPYLLDYIRNEKMPAGEKSLSFLDGSEGLNKSTFWTGLYTRGSQLVQGLLSLGIASAPWWLQHKYLADCVKNEYHDLMRERRLAPFPKAFIALAVTLPASVLILAIQKGYADITKNIQTKLIGVSSFLNGAHRAYLSAAQSPTLVSNLHTFSNFNMLADPRAANCKNFEQLMELFMKNTFKGKSSYASSAGRIVVANRLMYQKDVKDVIGNILHAIGELDAYVAFAKKVQFHQELNTQFSRTTFVNSQRPYVKSHGFWNLLVGPNCVLNDIELGGSETIPNIILTGPNTGGKSTLIKALMVNNLLSQTFGYAAAQHHALSPFTNLNCYMNISDDTGQGLSGLASQAKTARDLIRAIQKLPKDAFAFVIVDEIFTGTNPAATENLAYKFIKQLTTFKNVIFINATHYKKLIELEDETHDCKNCFMEAYRDESGKVVLTYKIKEGVNSIDNAGDVAKQGNVYFFEDDDEDDE